MSPAVIIARLALAVLFNVAALVLGVLHVYVWHDTGAALASAGGMALCAWMVSPEWHYVQSLIAELDALAKQS